MRTLERCALARRDADGWTWDTALFAELALGDGSGPHDLYLQSGRQFYARRVTAKSHLEGMLGRARRVRLSASERAGEPLPAPPGQGTIEIT